MKRNVTSNKDERLRNYGWTERLIVPELGPCWEISQGVRRFGYGEFKYAGKMGFAHRLAYETWVGPIPDGLIVRHKCDNPPCINPEHLEVGTQADNFDDMVERGRYASSVKRKAAKISEQEVAEIRKEYAHGILTQRMIGDTYGISNNMVSQIVNRRYWKNVS